MPCYNELETVETCVAAVLESPWVNELIIVDDGSTDGTRDILTKLTDPRVKVILQTKNGGKGSALRTGFQAASSDYVIVQDADLEYEPTDYDKIIRPLVAGKADVVFGSRFDTARSIACCSPVLFSTPVAGSWEARYSSSRR